VVSIKRADFDHGGTRNLAARCSRGSILVFMTQDVTPADEHWLVNLISPIASGEAVATFARQIPREDADRREKFARSFNYPAKSRIKELVDLPDLGYKAFFFSNACSAVKADVFWEMGGFPEKVIMNEDVLLCAKLLRAGYRVKYEAKAQVYHSHRYGLLQQFKRYFDIGVFVSQAGGVLKGAHTGTEGLRFVVEQAKYVFRAGEYLGLLMVFAEAGTKLLGFSLGKRQHRIPSAVKRRLSMHGFFWR
jgi:rhamnosyltransferase